MQDNDTQQKQQQQKRNIKKNCKRSTNEQRLKQNTGKKNYQFKFTLVTMVYWNKKLSTFFIRRKIGKSEKKQEISNAVGISSLLMNQTNEVAFSILKSQFSVCTV